MGGINPILQALLFALQADPYNHEDYKLSGRSSGSYSYKGKPVEFKLTITQVGNTSWIRGMIGDEVVDVKMVEPGKINVCIILPSDDDSKKDEIGLMFNADCEDQLRSSWSRVELLFGYTK